MFIKLQGCRKILASRHFPTRKAPPQTRGAAFKNWLLLGLGGNVGDVKTRFERLFFTLARDRRFCIIESSPMLVNAAFGYTAQADFLNAVLLVKTSLNAAAALKITQRIERRFGRRRSFKNAPRTLDIDLLWFSQKTRQSERLRLPHPGAKLRASVIIPLGFMRWAGLLG